MSHPKLPAQMGTPETIEKVMDAQIEMRLKPYMWFIKGFSACIGLLAIAGLSGKSVFLTPLVRWAYPPEVISSDLASLAGGYDIEKFGHQFFKTFGDHVDSGYSKTMIFEPNATPSDNYVLFYARQDQSCFATVQPDNGDTPFHFVLTIDNRNLDPDNKPFDRGIENTEITDLLRFGPVSGIPGTNLHILKVEPATIVKGKTIVSCVILVENKKDEKK